MATTLLLLVAMATLSSSDVTTMSPQKTTSVVKDGGNSKRSEVTSNLVEVESLREHQQSKDNVPDQTKLDRTNLVNKEIDVNNLKTDDIDQIGKIVDALERLGVLEQSHNICYSLAKIVRHKMADKKRQVDIRFVVNTYNAGDLSRRFDSDFVREDHHVIEQKPLSAEDRQINRCLRNKPAILLLDNSTAENDTSSVTYDVSSDTGNSSTVNTSGGRAGTSRNGGHEVVADHPKGLSRTQVTVITTCSVVIGVFFTVAVILRVRNRIKRKKESEAIARRPTFRSCSVSLRSQNENSTSRNALKEDEAEMIDKDEEEGAESPHKSPVNHSNRYLPLVNSCSAPSTPRYHANAQYESCPEHNDLQDHQTTPDNETYVAMDTQRYTIDPARSQGAAPDVVVEDVENPVAPPLPKKGVGRLTANLGISSKKYERMVDGPPDIPPRLPIKGPPRLTPIRKAPEPPPRDERLLTHNPPPSGHGTPRPTRLDMSNKFMIDNTKRRPEVILQPPHTNFMQPASSPSNASIASSLGNFPFANQRNNYQQLENHLTTPDCDSSIVSPHSSVLSPGETVSTEVETPMTIDNSPLDGIVMIPQNMMSPNVPVSFQNPAYSIVTSPEGVAANGIVTNGNGKGLMRHFKEYLRNGSVDGLDDTSPMSPMSPCSEASNSRSNNTLDDRSVSFYDARSMDSYQSVRSNNLSIGGSATCSPLHINKVANCKEAREQFRNLYDDHMREANGLDEDSADETPMTSLLNHSPSKNSKTSKKPKEPKEPKENGPNCNESSFLLGPEFEGMEPTYV